VRNDSETPEGTDDDLVWWLRQKIDLLGRDLLLMRGENRRLRIERDMAMATNDESGG